MDRGERFRALLAACGLAALLLAAARVSPLWPALVLVGLIAAANRRLFDYFRRCRGVRFAIGGLVYHQLYYLYSAAAFLYCLAEYRLPAVRRRRERRTHPA